MSTYYRDDHVNHQPNDNGNNENQTSESTSITVYRGDIFEDTLPWPLNWFRRIYLKIYPQNRGQLSCK